MEGGEIHMCTLTTSLHESLWAQGTRRSCRGRNVCVCFFCQTCWWRNLGGISIPLKSQGLIKSCVFILESQCVSLEDAFSVVFCGFVSPR